MTQALADQNVAPRIDSLNGWALVVDDHPLFCDALELTLRFITALSDIVTADSLAGGCAVLQTREKPDLILLDLNLPDVTGLDGVLRILREAQGTPVVVVSSISDNSAISATLAAGASGFIPKHSSRSVFHVALKTVAEGGVFAPDSFVSPDPSKDGHIAVSRLASLTPQQGKILELICDGKLNKQIAFDLSIAETTVKAHITAIMRKLGVHSRTQAVLVAQEARFQSILPDGGR